jgi:protein ImuB
MLSVWLDRLATDRLQRPPSAPGKPTVIVAKSANALRLTAVDAEAETLGLHTGLSLTDAHARGYEFEAMEADPGAALACLEQIAEVCRRYTPVVALDRPDGLILDIGGCAHLWGGEDRLGGDLKDRLSRLGFSCRWAIADTPELSWALARFSEVRVAAPGERESLLSPLPTAALRLEAEIEGALARVGLKTVGDLLNKPRAPLARRYGRDLLLRLDRALGLAGSPLDPKPEIAPYTTSRRFFEPIARDEDVLGVAETLAQALSARLESEGLGGRAFGLELYRVDGAVKRLQVACSRPLRDPKRIAALFAERIAALNDGLEADYGFDLLRLWALKTEIPIAETSSFTGPGEGARDAAELTALLDRLAVRLGPKAVMRAVPEDAHLPENAQRMAPPGEVNRKTPAWAAEAPAAYAGAPLRPIRLFRRPEPAEAVAEAPDGPPLRFTWRRVPRRVALAEGPERLTTEWWRHGVDERPRDYWRVEDDQGRRYWLFRQGLYTGAAAPRWFVHGLFA